MGFRHLAANTQSGVVTADVDANPGDVIIADPTAGSFTITLPNPAAFGTRVTVLNRTLGENPVHIAAFDGENIAGGPGPYDQYAGTAVELISDGVDWWRLT